MRSHGNRSPERYRVNRHQVGSGRANQASQGHVEAHL